MISFSLIAVNHFVHAKLFFLLFKKTDQELIYLTDFIFIIYLTCKEQSFELQKMSKIMWGIGIQLEFWSIRRPIGPLKCSWKDSFWRVKFR